MNNYLPENHQESGGYQEDYFLGDNGWENHGNSCPECGSLDTEEANFSDGHDDYYHVMRCNNCNAISEE